MVTAFRFEFAYRDSIRRNGATARRGRQREKQQADPLRNRPVPSPSFGADRELLEHAGLRTSGDGLNVSPDRKMRNRKDSCCALRPGSGNIRAVRTCCNLRLQC